ncbi:MAG: hypothetical protein GIS02_02335 [Methanosarcinales archaeon]|uniref:Dockerin domain-containing protein n=1 Tax=Candidatus Ethanoperedens thermophilum TaxID=2766897 RepID=A0A848D8Z2_9EURY|nr:hypothetical protein [Candidatus Ethanoperedens thermophilum]
MSLAACNKKATSTLTTSSPLQMPRSLSRSQSAAAHSMMQCSPPDVSGDGKVTSLDALMIMQAAAGTITL